ISDTRHSAFVISRCYLRRKEPDAKLLALIASRKEHRSARLFDMLGETSSSNKESSRTSNSPNPERASKFGSTGVVRPDFVPAKVAQLKACRSQQVPGQ